MKWLGFKRVAYSSITMAVADIRARAKKPHVTDLAQSIRETGGEPIQAPTVRVAGKKRILVCGRDRMAALHVLKAKQAWVHLVECTDKEAKELELSENIYRRADNRAELLATLSRLKEQQLRAEITQDVSGDTVPASQTIKAEARKQVARLAGVSPGAVKKAEQRAASKLAAQDRGLVPRTGMPLCLCGHPAASHSDGNCGHCTCEMYEVEDEGKPAGAVDSPADHDSHGEAAPAGAASSEVAKQEVPPPIDMLGAPRGRCLDGFIEPIQQAIDAADMALRRAQTCLALLEHQPRFPRALYQSLHADVHRLASLVRSYRPASICPWCKWDGLIVAECPGCEGAGWVSAEKADRAPRELLDGTNPVVFVRGRAVPLGQVLAHITPSTGAASPKKGGKQIKVEGPDGRVGTIAESDDGPTIVYDEPAADDEEIPL